MVQEELVQRVDIFAVFVSLVATSEVDSLRSLSLLLLDLTFAHSDLHAGFGKSLHGRCRNSRFVT